MCLHDFYANGKLPKGTSDKIVEGEVWKVNPQNKNQAFQVKFKGDQQIYYYKKWEDLEDWTDKKTAEDKLKQVSELCHRLCMSVCVWLCVHVC